MIIAEAHPHLLRIDGEPDRKSVARRCHALARMFTGGRDMVTQDLTAEQHEAAIRAIAAGEEGGGQAPRDSHSAMILTTREPTGYYYCDMWAALRDLFLYDDFIRILDSTQHMAFDADGR